MPKMMLMQQGQGVNSSVTPSKVWLPDVVGAVWDLMLQVLLQTTYANFAGLQGE